MRSRLLPCPHVSLGAKSATAAAAAESSAALFWANPSTNLSCAICWIEAQKCFVTIEPSSRTQ